MCWSKRPSVTFDGFLSNLHHIFVAYVLFAKATINWDWCLSTRVPRSHGGTASMSRVNNRKHHALSGLRKRGVDYCRFSCARDIVHAWSNVMRFSEGRK